MRFVFIQNLKSTKEPKINVWAFDNMELAKTQVQVLLDASIDVESVDVYEFLASAKKVTHTEWN